MSTEGYERRTKAHGDPRAVPLRIESIRPVPTKATAPAGTTRDAPEKSNAAPSKPIAPKGTQRDTPERGTPAVNSLLSFTTLPPPPQPTKRAAKSDAEREAALSPEVAKLIRFSLPARELLDYTMVAWRIRRTPASLEEIADALGVSTDTAARLRDELTAAGMIEAVRVGSFGKLAYRPAFHLTDMPGTMIVQKHDVTASDALRRLQAKIGYRPQ